MRILLEKCLNRGMVVELMYLSKNGEFTKRKVRILSLQDITFRGYCYTKKANRTFLINNVLACVPVVYRERDVI